MFGDAMDFSRFSPNFPKEVLCAFCQQIFSHKDREDLFGVTSRTRSPCVFCKRLAPLFLVKNVGCLFNPDFQAFCPDFRNSSQISGLLPRLSTNEIFWVHLQPLHPALYTTGWGFPQAWTLGPPMSKMLHLIHNIIMNKPVDLF